MVCTIFYMHQTSGECAGVYVCYCMYQMDKTVNGALVMINSTSNNSVCNFFKVIGKKTSDCKK